MKNFWVNLIKKENKLVFLAPMDWYTDSAYRQVVKKIAPDVVCVTEFFSADWLVHSKFLADNVLPHNKTENPLILQIFWKNVENFEKAAKIIEQKKYNIAWIDVNMWCPAKKVVKSWHWSWLIINTETAFEIVRKLSKATKLPISVKTRLSFDWNQNLIRFVKWLENAWANLITIHWRTTKQAYSWIANLDPIYELKNHIKIPIIANWDILNYDDWIKKIKNLDWFMIWRASFWNPWCFLPWDYKPTLKEILDIMEFHATKLVETKWEKKWSLEIRKHLVLYLKNFPWVKSYRKKLVTTENLENTLLVIEEIRNEFRDFLDMKPGLGEVTYHLMN
jgi:tRNA-dihydrouridine synthase